MIRPGTSLGPYEIIAPLGAGGMGEVYRARDERLGRDVAIKVLPPEYSADPDRMRRFEQEARAAGMLNHPNITAVYDIGQHEGAPYVVQELLEGETLRSMLAGGRIPPRATVDYALQIAQGLAAAHEKGIVHRDLKPENLFLTGDGRIKILDFGLVKLLRPEADSGPQTNLPTAAGTEPGVVLGTLGYMSPEQVKGRAADSRSDIFSFGCVLYEMLTGRRAFQRDTPVETMAAILKEQPAGVLESDASLPPALDRFIRHCLEKRPEDRFQSARDMAFDLASAMSSGGTELPRPIPGPKRRPWILIGAGALALAAVAFLALRAPFWGGTPARHGPPYVVALMDSPHPERVYDPETRKAGGTNADDLTDVLRDLPVLLLKENTNATWRREDEVLRQNPDLIVAHRSCFWDATLLGDPKLGDLIYPLAADKFETFLGYVGLGNPRTKFLVYSRRSWASDAERQRWVADVEKRFPSLRGRVRAWIVPLDRATFRNAQTGAEIRKHVEQLLGLDSRTPAAK